MLPDTARKRTKFSAAALLDGKRKTQTAFRRSKFLIKYSEENDAVTEYERAAQP